MKSVQHYLEMYRSAAQNAVPDEAVLAVGLVTRPGATKGVLVGQVSPVVGMMMRHSGKKKSGGFPLNALMAVTATRLISFEYRPRASKVKILAKVAEWHRGAVWVEPGHTGIGNQIFFHLADGSTVELEGLRSIGQYDAMNNPFYAALGLLTPA